MPTQNAFQPQKDENSPVQNEEKSYLFSGEGGQNTPSYPPYKGENSNNLPIWIGGGILLVGLLVLIFGNVLQNALKADVTADPLAQLMQGSIASSAPVATTPSIVSPAPVATVAPTSTPVPTTTKDPLATLLQGSLTTITITPTPTPTPTAVPTAVPSNTGATTNTTTTTTTSSTSSAASGTSSPPALHPADSGRGRGINDIRGSASQKP